MCENKSSECCVYAEMIVLWTGWFPAFCFVSWILFKSYKEGGGQFCFKFLWEPLKQDGEQGKKRIKHWTKCFTQFSLPFGFQTLLGVHLDSNFSGSYWNMYK